MTGAIRGRLDSWQQQKPVIVTAEGVPYLLLLGLAAGIFSVRREHGTELLVDVSLCAATAAWMLGMYTLNPAWRQRTRRMAVFVAGLLVLTAALVIRDSWFGFFAAVCFGYSRALLRWPWQMAGAACTAVIGALSQTSGIQSSFLFHLLHIYAKLGVTDRAAAVAEAFNRGLLTPGLKAP